MNKQIKWTMNDVTFQRSNYREVIARFDNSKCWLRIPAYTTTSAFKSLIRELAIAYSAKTIELKYFFDDNDHQTETNVVDFLKLSSGYIFRNELNVPEGCRRQFREYEPSKIFC